MAAGQVIQYRHFTSGGGQGLNQMRADKSGPARYQSLFKINIHIFSIKARN
jgi:hypothetical protein